MAGEDKTVHEAIAEARDAVNKSMREAIKPVHAGVQELQTKVFSHVKGTYILGLIAAVAVVGIGYHVIFHP